MDHWFATFGRSYRWMNCMRVAVVGVERSSRTHGCLILVRDLAPLRLADGCRLVDWIGSVPPLVGWGDLPTCRLAGAGKGALTRPFTIPGLGGVPTAGKAPSCGPCSTGRSRHAIPGLALPFAVILTAHRLRSPLRPARQTARTLAWNSKATIHALKTNCRSKRSSRCFDREIRLSRNQLSSLIDTSQALVGPISEA